MKLLQMVSLLVGSVFASFGGGQFLSHSYHSPSNVSQEASLEKNAHCTSREKEVIQHSFINEVTSNDKQCDELNHRKMAVQALKSDLSDRVVEPFDEHLYYKQPYSSICTIISSFDRDGNGTVDLSLTFSGSMVGPSTVLTSEDKTYRDDLGYPISISVIPGLFMRSDSFEVVKPFGEARVISASRGNFATTKNPNDNWALLELSTKIGNQCGWFDVDDVGLKQGDDVTLAGQIDATYYTYVSFPSTVLEVSDYSLKYSPSSDVPYIPLVGAPILNAEGNTVYGIHCFGKSTYNGTSCRVACKVSHYIKNWVYQRIGAVRFSLFSFRANDSSGTSFGTGHTWVSIRNETGRNVKIGLVDLAPWEGVTLGTWGNKSHTGLYYNLEKALVNNNPYEYSGRSSLTKYIKPNEMASMNQAIRNGDYWSLKDNCSYFGLTVWNAAFPRYAFEVPELPTPLYVVQQMQNRIGHAINEPIYGKAQAGYFENGTFIPVELEG